MKEEDLKLISHLKLKQQCNQKVFVFTVKSTNQFSTLVIIPLIIYSYILYFIPTMVIYFVFIWIMEFTVVTNML